MRNLIQIFSAAVVALVLAACGTSSPVSTTLGFTPPAPAGVNGPRPLTIPALREWAPAAGAFHWTPTSRIVLGSDDARLGADAATFADDLGALTRTTPAVVRGGTVHPGDIELDLQANDTQLGSEGYRLSIGPGIVISANAPAGAFYGTRSVLQLLHQNTVIPAGIARDWPHYPERGLAIDSSGSLYTAPWIEAHLREIAYLKMNTFHLHFSDTQQFSIESDTHPEIVGAQHLSKREVADIVALADRYHIDVVPEIDMPGHMAAILKAHPEFQLNNALGQTGSTGALDITNPAAVKFVQELIGEYLPLFPGPYWMIGGDEYLPAAEVPTFPQLQTYAQAQYGANANAKDALLGFFNRMDEFLRAHGKIARVYNDELGGGSAVALSKDVVVEWWTDFSPLSDPLPPRAPTLLDQGYTIMNIGSFPTYYNGGTEGAVIPTADPQSAYEHWEINEFAGSCFSPGVDGNVVHCVSPDIIAADEPRNLGTKVFVWGGGESQESIADKIYPRLRVITQKAWDSPPLVATYADFQPIIDAIGYAPGYAP
ncbi:MAG: family 20 glycosylhydrolase [Stenotrophobium sp.]